MITLIADSGTTKTNWVVVHSGGTIQQIITIGINPLFLSKEDICNTLFQGVRAAFEGEVNTIHFYAAGITGTETALYVQECFLSVFPYATSTVHSDMVAAARALCGDKPGIACILGTGSNSCFYDGENILPDKVPAGGFILGDEGGGSVLGRKLLSDFIKRQLPADIDSAFKKHFPQMDTQYIIQKVYREPLPARFMASFSPFLYNHRNNEYINNLLRSSFAEFFSRNISQYNYERHPVHIAGAIGYFYQDIIREEALKQGMTIGKVLKSPIEGLLKYHQS